MKLKHLPISEVRCPARWPICPRSPGPPTGGALSSPSPWVKLSDCYLWSSHICQIIASLWSVDQQVPTMIYSDDHHLVAIIINVRLWFKPITMRASCNNYHLEWWACHRCDRVVLGTLATPSLCPPTRPPAPQPGSFVKSAAFFHFGFLGVKFGIQK